MGQGMLVIIVDDEPDLREMLADILEDEGYTVMSFDGPRDALTLQTDRRLGVFLLDLMMPDMTGIELAFELQNSGFQGVPMVAMSASSAMLRSASASGLFQGTIPKPFDVDQLLNVLQTHMAS